MNTYRTRLLIAAPLCAAFITLVGATPISAQSPAAPAKTDKNDKKGGPLFSVAHDATLQGDGTSDSPLGITDSPTVKGSLASPVTSRPTGFRADSHPLAMG